MASYLSKFANFDLLYLCFKPLVGVTPFNFEKIFGIRNLVPGLIVRRCLRVPMFSHFSGTSTCDRHTDTGPWRMPRRA